MKPLFQRTVMRLSALNTPLGMFLIIGILTIGAFIVLIPAGTGPDESNHIWRVAAIAHGGILPTHFGDYQTLQLWGGQIPRALAQGLEYTNLPQAPDWIYNPHYFEPLKTNADQQVWAAMPNTAVYSPIPYLPSLAAYASCFALGFDVITTVYVMRITNAVAFLATITVLIRLLPGRGEQWLAAVLALFPVALFEASIVTADTATNAIVLAFSVLLASCLFFRDEVSRPTAAALVVVTIMLGTVKPTYAILAVLVLLVTQLRLLTRIVAFAGAGVTASVWFLLSNGPTAGMGTMRQNDDRFRVLPSEQLHGILSDPVEYLRILWRTFSIDGNAWFSESIGQLGYFPRGSLSASLITVVACAISLAIVGNSVPFRPDRRLASAAGVMMVVGSSLVIATTIYLNFTVLGRQFIEGIQGRYFYPLAAILITSVMASVRLRATRTRAAGLRDSRAAGVLGRHSALLPALLTIASISAVMTYRTNVLLSGWMFYHP